MKKLFLFILCCSQGLWLLRAQPCIPNTNSLLFDGVGSAVRINNSSVFDLTSAVTVEAWIYPTSFGASSTVNSIFCKHSWGSTMWGYVLRCGGNGVLSFNIAGAVGGSPVGWQEVLSADGALSLNIWTHVAATFDGSTLCIYINGILSNTLPFSGTIYPSTGNKPRIGALSDTVWGMSRYFNGYIDEVRVWNTARTQAEISSMMGDHLDPAAVAGLVGYWRFNEGTGMLAYELGTAGTYGNILNATWATQVPFNLGPPPVPVITYSAGQLHSSALTGNQWWFGGTLISGATGQHYTPTQYGNYTVVVTDTNGCSSSSVPFNYNTTGIDEIGNDDFMLSPNPACAYVNISLPYAHGRLTLSDINGRVVRQVPAEDSSLYSLNLEGLDAGIYLVRMERGGLVKKLVVY